MKTSKVVLDKELFVSTSLVIKNVGVSLSSRKGIDYIVPATKY